MGHWQEGLHPRGPDGRFGAGGGREQRRAARAADVAAHARVRTAGHLNEPRTGRDLTDWFTAAEQVDGLGDLEGLHDAPGDHLLTALVRRQGWDAPAHIGRPGDVDAAVASGWTEIHRGVGAFTGRGTAAAKAADAIAQETIAGDHTLGTGIYGNGDYFSVDPRVAQTFADGADTMSGVARERRAGAGATIRAALHPQARIVDYEDLPGLRRQWLDRVRPRMASTADVFAHPEMKAPPGMIHPAVEDRLYDPGRLAALLGYDAIRVRGKHDGSLKGRQAKKAGPDQYVILNRTALLVEAR